MERSAEIIQTAGLHKHTLQRVQEAMQDTTTEEALRERLKTYHIALYLRRSVTGRITGVTFIDHETRCVLNGSQLGKKYSANALNEWLVNKIQEQEKHKQKRQKRSVG